MRWCVLLLFLIKSVSNPQNNIWRYLVSLCFEALRSFLFDVFVNLWFWKLITFQILFISLLPGSFYQNLLLLACSIVSIDWVIRDIRSLQSWIFFHKITIWCLINSFLTGLSSLSTVYSTIMRVLSRGYSLNGSRGSCCWQFTLYFIWFELFRRKRYHRLGILSFASRIVPKWPRCGNILLVASLTWSRQNWQLLLSRNTGICLMTLFCLLPF